MLKKYNLCLFDLDGTLTDSQVGITKAVDHALRFFGIQTEDLDELKKFIGPPLRDSFRGYCNFTEAEIEEAINKFREYFSETGIYENRLYDGAIEVLSRLKTEGVQMVIATAKLTAYAERIAEYFRMNQYFDLIVGSELDGSRSRKGDVINYVLSTIDPTRRKSAVMIGDSKHDMLGGQETGIDTIGVTWGYGSRSELEEAKAMRIVDSFSELCNVLVLIEKPLLSKDLGKHVKER